VRAEEHHVPTAPPCPGDPNPDRPDDFISEDDLRELGIDPNVIRIACPWAVEYTGHNGVRCWAASDIANFLGRDES
jgi:hypothetical protein